ncbi:MAG: recombinase family protein [Bacteroidaceae bacterium]
MIYGYLRYSTDKQTNEQQVEKIRQYCDQVGMEVDKFISDEETSGTKAYTDRNLLGLIDEMKSGDTILVSEQSRLSRSIFDFTDILREVIFKKKGIIILCDRNRIYDSANMDALAQMELSMLSGVSQMERELISSRTKAALDAKKRSGGWISKTGVYRTKLGNPTSAGLEKARQVRKEKRVSNIMGSNECRLLYDKICELRDSGSTWESVSEHLNSMNILRSTGVKWTTTSVYKYYRSLDKVYVFKMAMV